MTDRDLWAIEQRLEKRWTEGDTFSDIQAPDGVAALLAEVHRLRGVLTKQAAIELHAEGLLKAVASLQNHLKYDLPDLEQWRAALQQCIDEADSVHEGF